MSVMWGGPDRTAEADLAVCILHGDLESEREVSALQAVRNACDPWFRRSLGTNDTTTLVVSPAGLGKVLSAVAANRRPWWQVRVDLAPAPPWWVSRLLAQRGWALRDGQAPS